METPGGRLDSAMEIMKALDQFEGRTATYVNGEAISAGAFISSVTHDIYFAPKGVIGAAAAVSSGGEDIQETMRLKINSYLKAKVRAYSEGRGYRAQVISAMMDKDYELKIGEIVIKPKGELLSLTDVEAATQYGEPPQPLLSAGAFKTLDALLTARFGSGNYRIERIEVTWSETLAQYITNYAGILLGLGILCIYIEFKTPVSASSASPAARCCCSSSSGTMSPASPATRRRWYSGSGCSCCCANWSSSPARSCRR
jgi:membrane-bound serine protease (ClpP class)